MASFKVRVISRIKGGRYVHVETYHFESKDAAAQFAIKLGLDVSLTVDLYHNERFVQSYTQLIVA